MNPVSASHLMGVAALATIACRDHLEAENFPAAASALLELDAVLERFCASVGAARAAARSTDMLETALAELTQERARLALGVQAQCPVNEIADAEERGE